MLQIVWFRRDLRLNDHAALWHACQSGAAVLPLFILDPAQFAHRETGSGRVQFLLECLADLDQRLQRRGSRLLLLRGRAEDLLPRLVHAVDAQAVYYSIDIERWSGQLRDRAIARIAAQQGWEFRGFLNYYVQHQGEYDPVTWREAWTSHSRAALLPAPDQITTPDITIPADLEQFGSIPTLADLGLPPHYQHLLRGGETAARLRMHEFLDQRIEPYLLSISKPLLAEDDGTSRMSAYFKFGCISQREAIQAARRRWRSGNSATRKSIEAWSSRIRWRDHFVQKFAITPQAEYINLYTPFDAIRRPEDANQDLLAAWRSGTTGYPLVDASMRALTQTGLLNFRMRAMLATFLTLNLFQAWQHGAEWFMQHLLDGDACVDHWQWQMQAGITQPGRAFIRCYNPTKQCYDNDPDARFIHRYIPELRDLPAPMVFRPWAMTAMEQQLFGVRIGHDYPAPIVDAEHSRQAALATIQPIREQIAAAPQFEALINQMPGMEPAVRRKPGIAPHESIGQEQ